MTETKPKIWVDTRQQKNKHELKHKQMQALGYELFKGYSSPFGDYSFIGGKIAVDTKKDVLELLACLNGANEKGLKRFKAECARATSNGMRLVILTEEMPPNGNIINWKSPLWKSDGYKNGKTIKRKGTPMTNMSMQGVARTIWTLEQNYNVRFEYCNRGETGKRIVEILRGEP